MWFEQRIEVIPAVDVLGAEAVRLHRGSYDEVVERAGIRGTLDDLVIRAAMEADCLVAEHVDRRDDFDPLLEPHVLMLAC